jgi:uncharacterized protein VirK/YbjX
MYPKSKFKQFKFIFRSLPYLDNILKLNKLFNHKKLVDIISIHPTIFNKPFRKYLRCSIDTQSKFEYIHSHYSIVSNKFSKNTIDNIYSEKGINLAEIETKNLGKCIISLCYIPALGKEGELTLLLSNNDKEIYSLAFSFSNYNTSDTEIIISGIQSRSTISSDIIKQLTKELFGMRPRNILFFVIRILAKELNIPMIKAVETAEHISNCSHVNKTDKFKADYNHYWEEESDEKIEYYYILRSNNTRKKIEDIASKKRSMYKKRFIMMDQIEDTMIKLLNTSISK